jgi:hypothetical protein
MDSPPVAGLRVDQTIPELIGAATEDLVVWLLGTEDPHGEQGTGSVKSELDFGFPYSVFKGDIWRREELPGEQRSPLKNRVAPWRTEEPPEEQMSSMENRGAGCVE